MGDTENSSSRSVDLVSRNQRLTLDVFNKVLCGLKELNDKDASLLGFEDELLTHFCRLPTRYAMDVNAERAEDVIMHKRLLQLAHNPDTRPKLISITPSTSSHQAKAKIIPVTQSKIRSPRCSRRKKEEEESLVAKSAVVSATNQTLSLFKLSLCNLLQSFSTSSSSCPHLPRRSVSSPLFMTLAGAKAV
ncbi:hypothetical protein DKX38_026042 [Salix brachista]|uniref:Uncharacterized protein n=1 Tax=Salix brachista TaxID=2182728 RepID=A0A5N5JVQ3_9ROSI|nr:hypothetical protein DKX38_026042 [Salix brachista]